MSVPPAPPHPDLPPGWHHPPPLLPVTVDASDPDIEVFLRAVRDPRGVADASHAQIRREPGGPTEAAVAVAWARRRGMKGWPWVLPVWMDAWRDPGISSTKREWRCEGWFLHDPLLLEPTDPPRRRPTDFWLEQRAKAITEAVVGAGLGGGQRQSYRGIAAEPRSITRSRGVG